MAYNPSTEELRFVRFHSDADPETDADTLKIHSLMGHEGISQLYQFELELFSNAKDLQPSAYLRKPAWVRIKSGRWLDLQKKKAGVIDLYYHGVLSLFEQHDSFGESGGKDNFWVKYRAVLVPRLWHLTLGRTTRIFQDQTVPEILQSILDEYEFEEKRDYKFELSEREFPKREYVVQYEESDFQFISRLLEYEGICYHFVQGGDTKEEWETVVFTDKNAFPAIRGNSEILYQPKSSESGIQWCRSIEDWIALETIREGKFRHDLLPSEVVLHDYNYRTPSESLKVAAPVVEDGVGRVYEYGNHYKTKEEGEAYAKIRAEELLCRETQFHGAGDVRSFRAGSTFRMTGHFRESANVEYVLTDVRHSAQLDWGFGPVAISRARYANEFGGVPADRPFRPRRTTPTPRIPGPINAKVDAAADGQYAELDEQGRYRVKIPFDLSDLKDGKATRAIRMTQPYGGPEYGIHFPLHRETEVLLTHVGGDPDRPVIAGAVYNPEKKSPVIGDNQTECVLRSGGNNEMRFQDAEDNQHVLIYSPKHKSYLSMGAEHSELGGVKPKEEHVPAGVTVSSEKGISINSAEGVGITAGLLEADGGEEGEKSSHDQGSEKAHDSVDHTAHVIAEVAAMAALAGGIAADTATFSALGVASMLADAAGFAGGLTCPGVHVVAPGKIALAAGSEAIVGAGGSATMIAAGPASVFSVLEATLAGIGGAAVVAAKNVEVVSSKGDVCLHALKKKIELITGGKSGTEKAKDAFQKIAQKITRSDQAGSPHHAEHKGEDLDIIIESANSILAHAEKDIHGESKDGKIVWKRGKSTITIDEDKITIQADTVILKDNDDKCTVMVGKEQDPSNFYVKTSGGINVDAEKPIEITTGKDFVLTADQKVKLNDTKIVIDSSSVKIMDDKGKFESSGVSINGSKIEAK